MPKTTTPQNKNELKTKVEKLERELKIARMCLTEDVTNLKEAKKELSDCVKAAARMHTVKKSINKLQISEYHWVQQISEIEKALEIYKREL